MRRCLRCWKTCLVPPILPDVRGWPTDLISWKLVVGKKTLKDSKACFDLPKPRFSWISKPCYSWYHPHLESYFQPPISSRILGPSRIRSWGKLDMTRCLGAEWVWHWWIVEMAVSNLSGSRLGEAQNCTFCSPKNGTQSIAVSGSQIFKIHDTGKSKGWLPTLESSHRKT